MEAKELRIGNYIQATHEIEIDRGNGIIEDSETLLLLRVRGIDEDSQLIDGSCMFSLEEVGTDYQLERYSNLEPIPLIEQWLLDLGFEDSKEYPLSKVKGVFRCNYGNRATWTYCNVPIPDIKHVHQLQNLYFTLTGEELTLKKNVDI